MFNAFTVDWEDWYQGLTSTSRRYEDWGQFQNRLARNTEKRIDLLGDVDITDCTNGFRAIRASELAKFQLREDRFNAPGDHGSRTS